MVAGTGATAARLNIMSLQYEVTKAGEIDGPDVAWLKSVVPATGWVLFDIKRVREGYFSQRAQHLTSLQGRLLHGYDAILVLTGSTAGTPMPLVVR